MVEEIRVYANHVVFETIGELDRRKVIARKPVPFSGVAGIVGHHVDVYEVVPLPHGGLTGFA